MRVGGVGSILGRQPQGAERRGMEMNPDMRHRRPARWGGRRGGCMARKFVVMVLATSMLVAVGVVSAGSSLAERGASSPLPSFCKANVTRGAITIKNDCLLSSGGRMFFDGPQASGSGGSNQSQPSFG